MTPEALEKFRQALEEAIRKQDELGFSVDTTTEQEKAIRLLTPLLQNKLERSALFKQLIIDSIADYQEEDIPVNKCQRCNTPDRLLDITAKCSDSCYTRYQGKDRDGYAPQIRGVCSDDYIEFAVCLECGQIQGNFPQPFEEED